MEFNGLPLHPLVVHAVVVFAPLAAISAIAYAVMPRWRWALRWPMVATTLVATLAAVVAVLAGDALLESRPELEALVKTHEERGELLRTFLLGFAVVVGLGAWRLGGPSGLKSGKGERPSSGGLVEILLMGLLVVGAVAVAVAVFLAGDSGSRAVWEL
ncbi:DUF2231 domain-containing protein [Nocardioides bigeumensis]|uniref:DUF2231 domain-containing protein n=1 Tax=Nocardioides bigeumensis TaxID=433657 RepID=A0ABP5K1H1_9ACTN